MAELQQRKDSVVFLDTQRRYTPGKALQFAFRRAPELKPTTRDWIGLFRVGWTSSRDYYTFEWVPKPSQERLQDAVTFAGNRLPPEDGYFYQVCYVSRDGTVRGASAPFQFCQPATSIGPVDDLELVEVEDEGMSLMLLQHKSKDELEQLRQHQREELASVEESMAALRVEKETLAGQLSSAHGERETLEGKLADKEARVEELQGVVEQREARVRELASQLSLQEKTLVEQVAEKTAQISALEDQLHAVNQTLASEQDRVKELLAVKSSEEGQIQLLKRNVEEHQVRLVAAKEEANELTKELRIKDAQIGDLQQLAESHTEEIEQLTEKLDDCICKLEEERTRVENLQSEKAIESEQLREEIATQQENIVELTGVNEVLNKQLQEADERPPVGPGSGRVVDKSIYEALHQAYDNMEEYYRKSDVENRALKYQLHQSQELVATLESRCDELLARIEKGKKIFEDMAKDLKQRRPTDRSAEIAELQARIREMEETEEQLTQACGDAVRELSTRKEEGKRQETRISELEAELGALQANYDQLQQRHDAKVQEKNDLLDQQQHVLDSKMAELAELQRAGEEFAVVRGELEKQVSELHGEKKRAMDQLREVAAEREAMGLKLKQYKAQLQQVHTAARPEPQRVCPVCDMAFPTRIAQDQYEQHVQGHFGD